MTKFQCYKCGTGVSWEGFHLAELIDELVSNVDDIPDAFTDYLMVTGPPVPENAFDDREKMMLCYHHTAEAVLLLFGVIQEPATLF